MSDKICHLGSCSETLKFGYPRSYNENWRQWLVEFKPENNSFLGKLFFNLGMSLLRGMQWIIIGMPGGAFYKIVAGAHPILDGVPNYGNPMIIQEPREAVALPDNWQLIINGKPAAPVFSNIVGVVLDLDGNGNCYQFSFSNLKKRCILPPDSQFVWVEEDVEDSNQYKAVYLAVRDKNGTVTPFNNVRYYICSIYVADQNRLLGSVAFLSAVRPSNTHNTSVITMTDVARLYFLNDEQPKVQENSNI